MTTATKRKPPVHIRQQEVQERKRLIREERQEAARREDAWIEAGRAETVSLEAARGVTIDIPKQGRGEARKPLRRKTGLQWLLSKDRITAKQFEAGTRYGDDWRTAEEPRVASCMGNMEGRVDGGGVRTHSDHTTAARHRLTKARIMALRNHQGMIAVCDAVCGAGFTVIEFGGSREGGEKAEMALGIALDLLEDHYGL